MAKGAKRKGDETNQREKGCGIVYDRVKDVEERLSRQEMKSSKNGRNKKEKGRKRTKSEYGLLL